MGNKHLIAGAIFILAILASSEAFAVLVLDGATPGFYNLGLGDLSLDSALGTQTDVTTGLNLFPAANITAGDPFIPPLASEPNLGSADSATQAAIGSFLGNTTSLGGSWSATAQSIPTSWTVNDETAIVYEIDAGVTGFNDLQVNIGVDNGVFVWFDGVYQLGALAPGGARAFEYSLTTGPVSPGTHFLQVLREDHGVATGWVISADATPASAVIPEPTTFIVWSLLGTFAITISWWRRRKHG